MKNEAHRNKKGFTLIETLVGAAVFLIVAIAAYGAYTGVFKLASLNQTRMLAVGLADEQFEMIRNLPYSDIGIVNGIPRGVLPASTTVMRGGVNFNVVYTIRDVDLPFDGTFGSTTNNDTAPADNKFVQISIQCPTCQNFSPVEVAGQVAPKNLENSTNNGALFIQVIDADGHPVTGANIHVAYTATTSPVIIDDTTNVDGHLDLVDLPPAAQAYSITASKPGYSSDQTYTADASNPTPDKLPATVAAQQLTQISFSIDKTSVLNIHSVTPKCVAVPNFHFDMVGAKEIGPGVPKYSEALSTNSSGSLTFNSMEWDSYTITPADSSYDLFGINPLNPVKLNPNSTENVELIVVPKNTNSLLVTVKDGATSLPLSGATVEVTGPGGYDVTQVTGQGYFSQGDWSHGPTQPGLYVDESAYASGSGVDTSTTTGQVLLENNMIDPYNTHATGTLDSSIFDTGTTSNFSLLSWSPAGQPPLTGSESVKFQFASSPTSTPSSWDFLGPDGTPNTYYVSPNTSISTANNSNEYARYRMFLTTDTATVTPAVSDVSVTYTSGCVPPGQVIFSGLSTGTYTVTVTEANYTTYSTNVTVGSGWQEQQVNLVPNNI
jgi:prepilin-type N-terminal cleavage/methylation domain-containing protein